MFGVTDIGIATNGSIAELHSLSPHQLNLLSFLSFPDRHRFDTSDILFPKKPNAESVVLHHRTSRAGSACGSGGRSVAGKILRRDGVKLKRQHIAKISI